MSVTERFKATLPKGTAQAHPRATWQLPPQVPFIPIIRLGTVRIDANGRPSRLLNPHRPSSEDGEDVYLDRLDLDESLEVNHFIPSSHNLHPICQFSIFHRLIIQFQHSQILPFPGESGRFLASEWL